LARCRWTPASFGGAPQASVGAALAPTTAPPKDDKPKVWAADIQITPNGKFLYSSERTTNKIPCWRAEDCVIDASLNAIGFPFTGVDPARILSA
jgi:Lactonase, 7-bladed beta-propeller